MSASAIVAVTVTPIDVELTESFGISAGRVDVAENAIVSVTLEDGTTGLGEAAPFPAVNGETRDQVLAALPAARAALEGLDARRFRHAWAAAHEALPRATPSALCAVETAVLDAFCRQAGMSMWEFFGARDARLVSDITLVTGDPDATARAAQRAIALGFRTLKVKIGGVPLAEDVARLLAVAEVAPGCGWLLDANAAMTVSAVCELLDGLGPHRSSVALLEQPTPTADLEALAGVRRATGVPVAADESARSARDVANLAAAQAADVVNLKITKCGLSEAMRMAEVARGHGLGLMVGGMVETPLAMTTSACFAGGLGGFSHVDLDTPLFMKHPPTQGAAGQGPVIELAGIRAGHGVTLRAADAQH